MKGHRDVLTSSSSSELTFGSYIHFIIYNFIISLHEDSRKWFIGSNCYGGYPAVKAACQPRDISFQIVHNNSVIYYLSKVKCCWNIFARLSQICIIRSSYWQDIKLICHSVYSWSSLELFTYDNSPHYSKKYIFVNVFVHCSTIWVQEAY